MRLLTVILIGACSADTASLFTTTDTSDTSDAYGLELEGVAWSYRGEVPDESAAGVTCSA